jgi:hypothetical protein
MTSGRLTLRNTDSRDFPVELSTVLPICGHTTVNHGQPYYGALHYFKDGGTLRLAMTARH